MPDETPEIVRPFRPGDRVRVINRKSYRAGETGTVTEVRDDPTWPGVNAEFSPGDSCLYGPSALERVEP